MIPIDLDFAMFDPPAPQRREDIIAVELGHRLVAATWYAHGDVYVTMESLGGLSAQEARAYLREAVQEAHSSRPGVLGTPPRGPRFADGRGFAREISHALREGRARWRMEEVP